MGRITHCTMISTITLFALFFACRLTNDYFAANLH